MKGSRKMNKLVIVLLMLITGGIMLARAATVSFAWDLNPVADAVMEYRLYERSGTNIALLGKSGTNSFVLTNVVPGKHIYFVTAVNAWGESPRSSEVETPAIAGAPQKIITIILP